MFNNTGRKNACTDAASALPDHIFKIYTIKNNLFSQPISHSFYVFFQNNKRFKKEVNSKSHNNCMTANHSLHPTPMLRSPLFMMVAVPGDMLDPTVETTFRAAVDKHWPQTPPIARVERFALCE